MNNTKICTKCKEEKNFGEFCKNKSYKDGFICWCKSCNKEYDKQRYMENKEEIKKRNKQHYFKNKDEISRKQKKWYFKNKDEINKQRRERHFKYRFEHPLKIMSEEERLERKEKSRQKRKIYTKTYDRKRSIEHHEELNEKHKKYNKKRRKKDVEFKILCNLRNRIWYAIEGNGKCAHTVELLGCTIFEFRLYIEKKWQPGMSWENYGYGKDKWNLHHIKYCHTFDLRDPAQQRLCFHYSNMIPMWQTEHKLLHKKDLC